MFKMKLVNKEKVDVVPKHAIEFLRSQYEEAMRQNKELAIENSLLKLRMNKR